MKLTLNPIPKKGITTTNGETNGQDEQKSTTSSSSKGQSSSEACSEESSSEACSKESSCEGSEACCEKEVVTLKETKKESSSGITGYFSPIEATYSITQLVSLIVIPEERDHARFGGSSASMWGNCLAHPTLMEQLRAQGFKNEQSEHTINGTMAHMCAELYTKAKLHELVTGDKVFLKNVEAAFELFVDQSNTPTEEALREEMIDAAEAYYEHVFKDALEGFITGKQFGFERKLTISKPLDMSGYVDFWATYINDKGQRIGVIVDFKFGRVEVEAKKNHQLLFYSIGLAIEEEQEGQSIDAVRVFIYQPKSFNQPWKESKFTKKQLTTGRAKFIKAARDVVIEGKTTAKMGDHCTWCKAKAICPKFQSTIKEQSGIAFLEPKKLKFPSIPTLTLDQAAELYALKEQFDGMFSELGKFLFSQAKLGTEIKGFKIVQANTQRRYIEDKEEVEKVLAQLNEEYGIKVKESKPRSFGKVEKDLKSLKKSEMLSEDLEKKFNAILTKPVGAQILVPESAKGEAIEVKNLLTVIDIPDEKFLEPKEAISKMGKSGSNIMNVVSETISHVIQDDLI